MFVWIQCPWTKVKVLGWMQLNVFFTVSFDISFCTLKKLWGKMCDLTTYPYSRLCVDVPFECQLKLQAFRFNRLIRTHNYLNIDGNEAMRLRYSFTQAVTIFWGCDWHHGQEESWGQPGATLASRPCIYSIYMTQSPIYEIRSAWVVQGSH